MVAVYQERPDSSLRGELGKPEIFFLQNESVLLDFSLVPIKG